MRWPGLNTLTLSPHFWGLPKRDTSRTRATVLHETQGWGPIGYAQPLPTHQMQSPSGDT